MELYICLVIQYCYRMNCFFELVAGVWVQGYRTVFPKHFNESLVSNAKEQLRDAILQITNQTTTYNDKLDHIAIEVRQNRHTLSSQQLRKLLFKSKQYKIEQKKLQDKCSLMETQLQALETNEFNKTVLTTLQTSAKALQKMGLNKDLQRTDKVISELEEGMSHSQDMTMALGTSLQSDTFIDDDDLNDELNCILGIDNHTTSIQPPPSERVKSVKEDTVNEDKVEEDTVKEDTINGDKVNETTMDITEEKDITESAKMETV